VNIHNLYRPFLRYFRARRMCCFQKRFHINSETRVLDVGGGRFNWTFLSEQPQLVFCNLFPASTPDWVVADGRNLPFADNAFDVVYSNSVIEHLGSVESQRAFAREVRRVGVRYYVQTPNRWFPVEPHLLTPLIHWFPHSLQRRLLRNFTIWGLVTRPSREDCGNFLSEVRLLDKVELEELFPEAAIWHERVLGFTKSLIVVKL
jgi:hypothetical protein